MAEIDKTKPGVVRAREGKATASFYEQSRRITVVADHASFDDALAALTALQSEVR